MTDKSLKDVHWHRDSLDVVREFPRAVKIDVGSEIYLLQLGRPPLHSKPIASVGRGVWEVRVKDKDGAFVFSTLSGATTEFIFFTRSGRKHKRLENRILIWVSRGLGTCNKRSR